MENLSYIAVISMLMTASVIDIRERYIPDALVLAGASGGIVLALLDIGKGLTSCLIGGMTAVLVLMFIHFVTKGSLGLGDVKLFGCTGIYIGFELTAAAMVIASVLSGLYSLILVLINRENKKREIPFAPFILAGTLAAILF